MRKLACLAVACAALVPALSLAGPATRPARVPADKPAAKLAADGKVDGRFAELHAKFLKRRSDKTRVLFVGASIMERFRQAGKDVWADHYAQYDADDFGVSGDQTQNVLWRFSQGELDGMRPKVLVLQIGNNNLDAGDTVDEAVAGVKAVIAEVHERLPGTKVLLVSLLPRGADPENPKVAAMRAEIKQGNAALAKLDDGDSVRYIDFGDKFLDGQGVIRFGTMNDGTHPTAKGYAIWAAAMDPLLAEMMR